ncbi:MAG TPA: hypothetical protein VH187_22315 [Scandinavium sp.]|jgi:hypothetical protein|uniref:hypothetical protein n=1 Tax=Scandinavium sp. TaxID=2830653 RepID=UPI002E311BDF|nr:hypothetical protein [Scandinavium sp.]HEX4503870.1 hypothetical protein [Scandinavium sp.]
MAKRFASDGWDASAALAKVNPTPGNLKKMHAYKDPSGSDDAKGSYSFPHHDVNADGSVGAANTAACSSGIGALNGGRGGHSLEPDEKHTVYNHLAGHLKDAGQEPPELKGGTGAAKASAGGKSFIFGPGGAVDAKAALGKGNQPVSAVDSKANSDLHGAIKDAVTSVHDAGTKVTSDGNPANVGNITVTSQHPDGSTTTTNHQVSDANSPGKLKVVAQDGQNSNDDSDASDAQIAAVNGVLDDAGVDTDGGVVDDSKDGMTADIGAPIVDAVNNAFSIPIMLMEGVWTGDSRYINHDALSWRSLPLPAMAKTNTGGFGHEGAELTGKLDSIQREPVDPEAIDGRTGKLYPEGTTIISSQGQFDTAAGAQEVARLVKDGMLRGISADIGDAVSELMLIDAEGNEVEDDDDFDIFDLLFGFTASADGVTIGEKIISGRIMGATICPFPAFEDAYVVIGETVMAASAKPGEERWPSMNITYRTPRNVHGLTASSMLAPIDPPEAWFADPMFEEISPITVENDGRVFGHMAAWTDCHIGYQQSCMKAPHSASDYSYFTTGYIVTQEGSQIPTGVITMGTGHAELWQSPEEAKAHYDNTGTVVADINVGEDPYGIWVAGALRPDVDELTPRRLRAAGLSGDWRELGGHLELIASLAVNVQGFPIKRPRARVASGRPVALVAAGAMTPNNVIRLRERMKNGPITSNGSKPDQTLATATEILSRQARQALRQEVHNKK